MRRIGDRHPRRVSDRIIRLVGDIKELIDVAVLPAARCPMAIGTDSPEIRSLLSFDPEIGSLVSDG